MIDTWGGEIRNQQSQQATLQERVAALTQPMPGHETQLVDFEKRRTLTPQSAKTMVAVAAIAAVIILGLLLWKNWTANNESYEDSGIINPAGRDTAQISLEPPAGVQKTNSSVEDSSTEGEDGEVVVSVQGRVKAAGLLRINSNTRVGEAIDQAGGLLPGADVLAVNLAEKVTDGMQIVVDDHGSQVHVAG